MGARWAPGRAELGAGSPWVLSPTSSAPCWWVDQRSQELTGQSSLSAQTCWGGRASLQGPQGEVDPPLALLVVAGGSVLGSVDKVKGQGVGRPWARLLGVEHPQRGGPARPRGRCWPCLSGGALGWGGPEGSRLAGTWAAGLGPQRGQMASGPHLGSPPERSVLWPLAGWGHLGPGPWKGSPARLFP